MKPSLVLVDHGSRRAEANAVLERLAELVRAADPGRAVRVAHMELAAPTVADAIADCAAAGAREVVVVPVLLAPGSHAGTDVPRLAREAATRHPEVSVRIADPLGAHPKLAEIVLERAAEAESR